MSLSLVKQIFSVTDAILITIIQSFFFFFFFSFFFLFVIHGRQGVAFCIWVFLPFLLHEKDVAHAILIEQLFGSATEL